MHQPASSASSSGPSTFAGILAALAAPAQKGQPAWNDDDLANDVATLSYERALSAHARYRTPEPADRSLTDGPLTDRLFTDQADTDRALAQPVDAGSLRIYEALRADADWTIPPATLPASYPVTAEAASETAQGISTAYDRSLKRASITIRLSKTECAQLRERAAEAGLTVSAYLRSCTFEAESLRALVKDTLAKLRTQASKEEQDAASPPRGSWFRRWRQLWPHGRASQPIEQG
jgi:hypothetical protein